MNLRWYNFMSWRPPNDGYYFVSDGYEVKVSHCYNGEFQGVPDGWVQYYDEIDLPDFNPDDVL